MTPQYISFFHNSDEYREEFTHKDLKRPCFYWFSDRFHSHIGIDSYFYLFVKNPTIDNISMRARSGNDLDFNDLFSHFLYYKNNGVPKLESGELRYAEPPIIMSFDKITPDLIAKYNRDAKEYEVIKPTSHTNVKFKLWGDKQISTLATPFTEIPELANILPMLKKSLPFEKPDVIDNKYIYANWIPMKTEKNGTWM